MIYLQETITAGTELKKALCPQLKLASISFTLYVGQGSLVGWFWFWLFYMLGKRKLR